MKWFDIVGLIGVIIIVSTYALLQLEKIKSENLSYSLLNAIGAGLIIFSLCFDFNFSAFIVEFFWMLTSIYGIGKNLIRKRHESKS